MQTQRTANLVITAALFGLFLSVMPFEGFAQTAAKTERYYDLTSGKWKTRKAKNYSSSRSRFPKKIIPFSEKYSPGTIIIDTSKYNLYYVLKDNQAIQYGVGVGRTGFTWSGKHKLTRKAEWPSWRPPPEMIKREALDGRILPTYMPGGPDNPLGARALYIGSTIYRIHGTNQPWTIGQSMSSGCIRLTNEDIIDLYGRARIGAKIIVRH